MTAPNPDVLLLSARVGAGHVQAARAVADALAIEAPQLSVQHVELLSHAAPWFRRVYTGLYTLGMTALPGLYGKVFQWTDRPDEPELARMERLSVRVERRCLGRVRDWLRHCQPRVMVHTHFLSGPLCVDLRRQSKHAARQYVVVTDRRIHRWWYCPGIDHWFVGSEQAAGRLGRWGVAGPQVTLSGIPVQPKWTRPLDRPHEAIRRQWRLPPRGRIVVLTCGTDFTVGPVVEYARAILAAGPDVHVGVLAGQNKELLGTLAQTRAAAEGRLTPIGFTDRLAELTELAEVVVTKAGGITTAECAAKATPMVLLNPVPGQEAGNAEFLVAAGAARLAHTPLELKNVLRDLLGQDQARAALARSAGEVHRPAATTIARHIRNALSG